MAARGRSRTVGAGFRRSAVTAVSVAAIMAGAACGGGGPGGGDPLPPPAEPAGAPPAAETPAGRVIEVGSAPEGIVADATTRTVAVAVRDPDGLVLLDADTGAVTGRAELPGELRHLQLAGPGGPVLVPGESFGSLIRVELPDGRVSSQVMTGIGPHDATRAADGTVFVANEFGGNVVAVRDGQIAATFTGVTQPGGIAAAGDAVGLIDVRENTITFYGASGLDTLGELPAGDGPTHVVADRSGRLIVTDTRGGQLLVFDTVPEPRLAARLAMAGDPYGLAYDPDRHRLWVTLTASNQLVGLDLAPQTPRELHRLPTVRQPNTVAVDPVTGRVFVTGTADGTVQVIEP